MATLILMRHANAEFATPGMRDFERPLSAAGWAEANSAAILLKATGITPSKTVCSPARRTTETLDGLRKTIDIVASTIEFHPELYSGDAGSYQKILPMLKPNDTCLFVGHNPMIEHFALHLAQSGQETDLKHLKMGFPTAAIAVFELVKFPVRPDAKGTLTHFLNPKSL